MARNSSPKAKGEMNRNRVVQNTSNLQKGPGTPRSRDRSRGEGVEIRHFPVIQKSKQGKHANNMEKGRNRQKKSCILKILLFSNRGAGCWSQRSLPRPKGIRCKKNASPSAARKELARLDEVDLVPMR